MKPENELHRMLTHEQNYQDRIEKISRRAKEIRDDQGWIVAVSCQYGPNPVYCFRISSMEFVRSQYELVYESEYIYTSARDARECGWAKAEEISESMAENELSAL